MEQPDWGEGRCPLCRDNGSIWQGRWEDLHFWPSKEVAAVVVPMDDVGDNKKQSQGDHQGDNGREEPQVERADAFPRNRRSSLHFLHTSALSAEFMLAEQNEQ